MTPRRLPYALYRLSEMLIAVASRFVNAAILGGSTHQTISARAYVEGWAARRIINRVFFWQGDHCRRAWELEIEHARKTLKRARARTKGD